MSMVADMSYKLALISQAVATLGADSVWDEAVSGFLRTFSLWQADQEFGAKAKADNDWAWHRIAFEGRCGKEWRHCEEIAAEVNDAEAASQAAEDIHHEAFVAPYWKALRDVATTPAPTIAAATFKQLLIQAEEVWNDSAMKSDCMKIVQDDFSRLARRA